MKKNIKNEFKQQLQDLMIFMVKNNIGKAQVSEMCNEDPELKDIRDFVGNRFDHFEWIVHPKYAEIECSTEGDIRINGMIQTPKNYKGYKVIKYVRGKKTLDIVVASTVLSAFRPMPTDGKYTVGYRDENPDNCRIQNLYWKYLGT